MNKRIMETASTTPPWSGGITIKSAKELDAMRRAGKVVGKMLKATSEAGKPGVRTKDLDAIAARVLREEGAGSPFKGYHGFPAVICASVNEEIVHGIPGDR